MEIRRFPVTADGSRAPPRVIFGGKWQEFSEAQARIAYWLSTHQGIVRVKDALAGEGGQVMPVVEAERDLGSLACQEPRAALARNVSTASLKTSGSSRLAVWPVRGSTPRPAVGMVRLSMSAGSRQPSSSSPTRIRTGTLTVARASVSAYSEGLSVW